MARAGGGPPKGLGQGSRDPVGPISVRSFGKYYLIKKLAEGGMAEIFLAKQVGVEGFEKNIVLKRMLAHLSSVPDFVSMFLDEARLASRLSHPNVVQIHDLGFEEGCYFIAMEYLAGEDFSTVIRSHARARQYVPLHIVLRVLAEAAHGLHYAHDFTDAKGVPLHIVHRDVSPSNVFVTYTGQVKLLDFGIAKAESRLTQTTAGVVKGKYQYMSPEQAGSGLVDRRADVYSLGVCLYEALTNFRPFARDTDLAILNAVLKNEFRPPREARPDLPIDLDHLIVKALAPLPEARYQSAAEFAQDAENFLRSMTSSASGAAVAQFMTHYFGPERVASRTRIETLDELKAAAGLELAPPAPPSGSSASADGISIVTNFGAEPKTPSIAPPGLGRRRLRAGAGLLLALGVLVGGTMLLTRAFDSRTTSLDAGAVVTPSVPDAAVAVASADDAAVPPGPLDSGAIAALEPDAGARPVPLKPVMLTTSIITGVVRKGSAPVARCFEQHKADLEASTGQIAVTFTIASSGRVTRATSALPGKPVGKCLEERVRQLRFPPHVDKEVTVTLPFAYQVAQ